MDDSDDAGVDDCPHCGKPIAEDAEWCHHCGQYLSREDAPWRVPPLWIIVGAALGLLLVFMWII
jgi:predicted nucleic acid-binding Zn ribbon protein